MELRLVCQRSSCCTGACVAVDTSVLLRIALQQKRLEVLSLEHRYNARDGPLNHEEQELYLSACQNLKGCRPILSSFYMPFNADQEEFEELVESILYKEISASRNVRHLGMGHVSARNDVTVPHMMKPIGEAVVLQLETLDLGGFNLGRLGLDLERWTDLSALRTLRLWK